MTFDCIRSTTIRRTTRMGDPAPAPVAAASDLVGALYAAGATETAEAEAEGRLTPIRLVAAATLTMKPKAAMASAQVRDSSKLWRSSILDTSLFGRNSLSAMRPRVKLGQLYATPDQQYAAISKLIENGLAAGKPLYDVFVDFAVAEKPANVPWDADAFQINEAIKALDANYASQSSSEAAAFGVRFPEDLRADIAYKRLSLSNWEYDDYFLGFWTPIVGHLNGDQIELAQGYLAQLGSRPTFLWQSDLSDYLYYVQTLTGNSQALELWYAHVFRALCAFVPAAMVYYYKTGRKPSDIYNDFAIPNVNALHFNLWVVAASTFMFERFGGDQALRDSASDGFLNEIKAGFELAGKRGIAEFNLGQLIGASIQSNIDALSRIQHILRVLALPVTVALAAGDWLAGGEFKNPFPDLSIPWYVWAGLFGIGAVATYAVLK